MRPTIACSNRIWPVRGPRWNAPMAGWVRTGQPTCAARAAGRSGTASPRGPGGEAGNSGNGWTRFAWTAVPWSMGISTDARSDREYEETFRNGGPESLCGGGEGRRRSHQEFSRAAALVAALDDWAVCRANSRRLASLLAVARLADPDPWRDRARDPLTFWNLANLKELTTGAPIQGQSVQLLVALGERLHMADPNAALPWLRKVQQAHPGDFFANFWVAHAEDSAHAVGYYRVAQALRPDTLVANINLGFALKTGLGRGGTPSSSALSIDPKPAGHAEFAEALGRRVRPMKPLTTTSRPLVLAPKWPSSITTWHLSGTKVPDGGGDCPVRGGASHRPAVCLRALHPCQGLDETGTARRSREALSRALTADPQFPNARSELGTLLLGMNRLDEAADQFRQIVARHPREVPGGPRRVDSTGRLEERVAWQRRLRPTRPSTTPGSAMPSCVCFSAERTSIAAPATTSWHALAAAWNRLSTSGVAGPALLPGTKEELANAVALTEPAVAAGRKGHESAYPYYWFAKGLADYRLGRYDEAIAAMRGRGRQGRFHGAESTPDYRHGPLSEGK